MVTDLMNGPQNDPKIPDPFEFKKIASLDNTSLSKKVIKQLKLFTKYFDSAVYDASANVPQIQTALTKWKWNLNPGDSRQYQKFVIKYDMNYDGRLNPREFILGSLHNNIQTVGSPLCDHCFFDISKNIDAIFLYLDCNNDGLLTAEEIWTNLPKMKRNTEKYNIFFLLGMMKILEQQLLTILY